MPEQALALEEELCSYLAGPLAAAICKLPDQARTAAAAAHAEALTKFSVALLRHRFGQPRAMAALHALLAALLPRDGADADTAGLDAGKPYLGRVVKCTAFSCLAGV